MLRLGMGPRALAASSGLAPWSMAVDWDLWYKNFERGSRGPAPLGCLPHWGREGVTLPVPQSKNPNDSYRVEISVSWRKNKGNPDTRIPEKKLRGRLTGHAIIPYGLLRTGRHRHRSGSRHTCPCRPSPSRSPLKLLMRDTRSHRSRIRYTFLCLRQLPTHSLRSVCFGGRKKRVSFCCERNGREARGSPRVKRERTPLILTSTFFLKSKFFILR